jgi:drug/metabolite transporter (DMT)-like permease
MRPSEFLRGTKLEALVFTAAPIIFVILVGLFRQNDKFLPVFLVLWFASTAAQVLWAFLIQRHNPRLATSCFAMCVTQLVVFFLVVFRHLPLGD